MFKKTLEQKGLVDVEIKSSCVNMNHFFIAVARIGFSPVSYQASETDGFIMFVFGVLEGNIAFDVNVLFETSDGSAQGMK